MKFVHFSCALYNKYELKCACFHGLVTFLLFVVPPMFLFWGHLWTYPKLSPKICQWTNNRSGANLTKLFFHSQWKNKPVFIPLQPRLVCQEFTQDGTPSRGRIFSRVRPFYELVVSNLDMSMHRSLWVQVAHSSFIDGSHMTKNTDSGASLQTLLHNCNYPTRLNINVWLYCLCVST